MFIRSVPDVPAGQIKCRRGALTPDGVVTPTERCNVFQFIRRAIGLQSASPIKSSVDESVFKLSAYPVHFEAIDFDHPAQNTFQLRIDRLRSGGSSGPVLATVIVDPAFDGPTVERFMFLLTRAPELWRSLRRLLIETEEIEAWGPWIEAYKLLWDASGTNPFGREISPDIQETKRAIDELFDR